MAQFSDPDLAAIPAPRDGQPRRRGLPSSESLPLKESTPRLPAQELQALIDASPDLMITYTRDGTRLFVNQAVATLYGASPESLVGIRLGESVDGVPEVLDPGTREALRNAIRLAFDLRQPCQADVVFRVSGQRRTVSFHLVPEVDRTGAVTSVLGIGRDITDLNRVERDLQNSRRSYHDLFDNVPDQMILLEIHPEDRFRILDINPAMERAVGVDREQVVGKFQDELYDSRVDRILVGRYRACIDVGVPVEGEITLELPSGPRIFRTTTVPARDQNGKIVRLANIVRDVTEQHKEEAARRRLERALRTLSSGNEVLVRATDESTLLSGIARVAIEIGGYQRAWIGYADASMLSGTDSPSSSEETTDLPVTVVGWDSADPRETSAERPDPQWLGPPELLQEVLDSGEPRMCHPGTDPGPWESRRSTAERLRIASSLTMPLIHEEKVFGVFVIHAVQAEAFNGDELRLLTELAADLAYGIHNVRSWLEQDRNEERARNAMNATVQALADTTELRDPYTAGHQRRVAQLAQAVGQRLGLSEDRVAGLYLASTIHDIGKISVPAEILGRPGGLSNLEYSIVQQHVTAAYELLRGIEFPWPVADIVVQHHERCDGSGYPAGLTGDQMLLESRILAVCDVVEAMSSHRPYRPGLGMGAAVRELVSHRGTLYDAEVVDACVGLIREGSFHFH